MKKLHPIIIKVEDGSKLIQTLKKESIEFIQESDYILEWGFKMALTRYNNTYIDQKSPKHITSAQQTTQVSFFRLIHRHQLFTSIRWI